MAKRTTRSSHRTSRPTGRAAPKTGNRKVSRTIFRLILSALRWLGRVSRPRTAAEVLAFLLVCLGLVTLVTSSAASIRSGERPGLGLFWSLVLFALALAARLSPWWRSELRAMTPERARSYSGSALLVFVLLSLSWHLISGPFGLGDAFLLLGPFSQPPGAIIILAAIAVVAGVLILNVPVHRWSAAGYREGADRVAAARERRTLAAAKVEFPPIADEDNAELAELAGTQETDRSGGPNDTSRQLSLRQQPALPSIEIFDAPPKLQAAPVDLDLKAQRIQETLASFNVSARVVGHHSGPVVTQFDVQPARGVKVRKITELQNDLALALAAPTIRIQAPVPGKPVVGIEIPNSAATMVVLRELLENESYTESTAPLRVALGKDVAGNPAIIDLAKMPHLLVAGATGSGKSVFINALISCLLYQNTPEDVRLMLVDPKMVELTVYNGVPHLLSPVVTQMDKVVGVLQWALREMERRYQLFADATVRNIQRYNEKMDAAGLKRLPYIVFIIDELADLMMVAPEDVEEAICRLAQLARACGIHLVIATQRPSVDVITGLIKANFPARIAFAMTSQVDSRTILDTVGAEKLLGRGDMLYQPPDGPKPIRLQGAYLREQEIERLVEFWKGSPFQMAAQRIPEEEFVAAEKAAHEADDELLGEAVRVVREYHHASVSLLQRRLKVGYSRAARLMDQLEERGVVGPADGSKQRPVLQEGDADL